MKAVFIKNKKNELLFWYFICSISLTLGVVLWISTNGFFKDLALFGIGLIIVIIILRFPVFGFGIVIVSSNITQLLPNVPFFSSAISIIGILTLITFFIHNWHRTPINWRFSPIEILGFLFIVWIFISNPAASFYGSSRLWIFTLVQLWLLLWMAKHFITSEQDNEAMMWVVVTGILVSAFFALLEVGFTFGAVERASGLSGAPNTIARFCVYGVILLSYLQSRFQFRPIRRLLIITGILILIAALIYSGSRTGLLLLGLTTIFLSSRYLVGRRKTFVMWIVIGLGLAWVLNQTLGSTLDPTQILDSIFSGSDTIGTRYRFWQIGWAMWLDNPIAGVGIGRYGINALSYWKYSLSPVAFTTHNTFIQVLSETGIIGFFIFFMILLVTILNFLSNIKTNSGRLKDIQWTWLIIFVILLVGGLTKTDLTEKFLWFLIGVSARKVTI